MKIRSLSLKVIITLAITISVLMFITGYVYYLYETNRLNTAVRNDSVFTMRRLKTYLHSASLSLKSYEIATVLFSEMYSNHDVYAVILYSDKGMLFGAVRNDRWTPVRADNDDFSLNKYIIGIDESSVQTSDQKNLKIKLFISGQQKILKIISNLKMLVYNLLILSLLFFISLYIIIHYIIINPIQNLTSLIKEIEYSDSNLQKLIFSDSHDELGELGTHFNKLMSRLNSTLNQKNSLLNQLEDSNMFLQKEIKERIFAEDKVRSSRKYIETIFYSIASVLFTVDASYKITECNKDAAEFFRERNVNEKDSVLEQIDILKQCRSGIESAVIENRKADFMPVKEMRDANIRYYSVSTAPFMYNGIQHTVIRIDDITDSVRKDEQLVQTLKMEGISELAGGIAHDFNNILGGILGSVFLSKMDVEDEESSLYDNLCVIESAAKRAGELIRQLTSISGSYSMDLRPVNLNLAVENITKLITKSFDKSISISFNPYNETLPYISGDITLIEQVVLNLAINACHAMTIMRDASSAWGGELGISVVREKRQRLRNVPNDDIEGEYYIIQITDTGVGITEDNLKRIYDPFFTTKNERGSGLRLSIVYTIIKQHNGFIHIESVVDRGSVFSIYVPVLSVMPDQQAESYTGDGFVTGTGTVLLIEDDDLMRRVIREMLIQCGYTVMTAQDGIEGVSMFTEHSDSIDLVILDMIMPKISGKETYRDLKKINKSVKVLLTSGFKGDERIEKTLEMGADDFIQKPFILRELSEKVHTLIDNQL